MVSNVPYDISVGCKLTVNIFSVGCTVCIRVHKGYIMWTIIENGIAGKAISLEMWQQSIERVRWTKG